MHLWETVGLRGGRVVGGSRRLAGHPQPSALPLAAPSPYRLAAGRAGELSGLGQARGGPWRPRSCTCLPQGRQGQTSSPLLKSPQPLPPPAASPHTHTHTHALHQDPTRPGFTPVPLGHLPPQPQSSWCGGQPGAAGQPPPTFGLTGVSWMAGCWPTTPRWTP